MQGVYFGLELILQSLLIFACLIILQFPTSNPAPPPFGTYGTLGLPPTLMSPNQVSADQYSVTKPRMRICFDPETEIPKLQKWFSENNHPTRQQVKKYISI